MFCANGEGRGDSVIRFFAVTITFCSALAFAEPVYQHGLSFYGEFKYPPDFEHFDYVNPDAPKGGVMVLATGASWNSFTPYLAKGNSVPGYQHDWGSAPFLYDGLFTQADDEIGTFYGNLAEAVMVADDFRWMRIRLRPEARWHDGQPITARDVQFTFQHIRDHSSHNLRSAFGMVDSVEIHDEREFTFHLLDIVRSMTKENGDFPKSTGQALAGSRTHWLPKCEANFYV